MMRLTAIPSMAAVTLSIALAGMPRSAAAQDCDNNPNACANRCNESISCSTSCILDACDWPRQWVTCGQWGVCHHDDPPCEPQWEIVNQQLLGYFEKNVFHGNQFCRSGSTYWVTLHDTRCGRPDQGECLETGILDWPGCCSFSCTIPDWRGPVCSIY
jgi:hypothetical protein